MKKFIKQELMYGIYSKNFLITFILLCALFGIVLFLNYSSVTELYSEYNNTITYYEENNINIEEELAGDYEIELTETGGVITNPIAYYKNTISRYLYAASPKYRLTQLLESSILYFPIVFGTLGLLVATNDFRFKTIKLRTVRLNKSKLGIVKQVSLAISSFAIMFCALIVAFLSGELMYQYLIHDISIKDFVMDSSAITSNSSIFLKFAFAYIIALIFTEIGYTLGILFKNMYAGLILIIAYIIILPNLKIYDLKNSIFYFGNKTFDYYGVVSINVYEDMGFISSLFIILFTLVGSILINNMVLNKRSSFEG